jgi:glycine dehydrogenase subunit 2
MMIIDAYHKDKGNKKKSVIVPDSAHGTNPASSTIAGYQTISVPTGSDGIMDMEELKKIINDDIAAIMLTCPNTLGIFNPHISEIAEMAHKVDALMYCDGANLNAILGKVRPGDIGFDLVHVNLHKTFAAPHGGGGPGSGPVGVVDKLTKYLPISLVVKRDDGTYSLQYDRPASIGYIAPFYGNFLVILKAYAWVLLLGREGLNLVSDDAVLNANYLKEHLKKYYSLPYDKLCKHEFVLSVAEYIKDGLHAIDFAKGLIDCGFHPPTINFPLIVKEALMIEPTESESRETLDQFIKAMIELVKQAKNNPQLLKDAPKTTPVSRLDEVSAARNLNLSV